MVSNTNKKVYRNGTLDSRGKIAVPYHLGHGVFETFRARLSQTSKQRDTLIRGKSHHFARLVAGIEEFRLEHPPTIQEIDRVLTSALGDSGGEWLTDDVLVRIVVWDNEWTLSISEFQPTLSKDGISCIPYEGERAFPHIKSCSAAVSVMARRAAERQGFDEALLVDRDGILREGAWSNFFWVSSDGLVLTPKTKILLGITRHLVISSVDNIHEVDVSLKDIQASAVEAFITQSTNGIVPVTNIGGHQIGNGTVGATTAQIMMRLYQ